MIGLSEKMPVTKRKTEINVSYKFIITNHCPEKIEAKAEYDKEFNLWRIDIKEKKKKKRKCKSKRL